MFRNMILLAGAIQLAIAASSLAIPRFLGWREETLRLKPLTRQVFWTYAVYILSMNFAFGTLSVSMPDALIDGSMLSRAVCGIIAAYWIGRLVVQFFVFDRSIVSTRPLFRFAEAAYLSGFAYLAIVYTSVAADVV